MWPDLAVEPLSWLIKPLEVVLHPGTDAVPAVRQRLGILPNGDGDDIALLAGEGRVSMKALLAFQHRDEALLDLRRRLADLSGGARVAANVDVHVASSRPGEGARDAAPREARGSTMMGRRRSAARRRI
jgi:hypothetical protein